MKRSGGLSVSTASTGAGTNVSPRPIVGASSGQPVSVGVSLQGNNSNSVGASAASLSGLSRGSTAHVSMLRYHQQQQQQQLMQRQLLALSVAQQTMSRNPLVAMQQQQQQQQQQQHNMIAQFLSQQQQSSGSSVGSGSSAAGGQRAGASASGSSAGDLSRFFSPEILAAGQRGVTAGHRGLPEERMMTVDEVERASAGQH